MGEAPRVDGAPEPCDDGDEAEPGVDNNSAAANEWATHGWVLGPKMRGGRQGKSYLAHRRDDPNNEFRYVLKAMDSDQPARRALFHNEVSAMRALDHPGLSKLVDSNTDQNRTRAVELFLVTERINGTDLQKGVDRDPLPFDDAVRMTIRVLESLQHCHERGVFHRDIKPCHIVFRNHELLDPVLIDFGIAYTGELQTPGAETNANETRGNKFLFGPEHAPGSAAANRTGVTDITQCIGLLFFALTGKYPRSIGDTADKKPHQNAEFSAIQRVAWKRKELIRIFDSAFEWELTRRWQTIPIVIARLSALLANNESAEPAFELDIDDDLRRLTRDSHTMRVVSAKAIADAIFESLKPAIEIIKDKAAGHLRVQSQAGGGFLDTIASLVIAMDNTTAPVD